MTQLLTYISLALSTAAYAGLISTPQGKDLVDRYTTVSVVAGVSLVLVFLRFILPGRQWLKVVAAFILAGLPMVIRFMVRHR